MAARHTPEPPTAERVIREADARHDRALELLESAPELLSDPWVALTLGDASGVQAARQMVAFAEKGHLVITPDGPRGPRRRVQAGLVYVAAKTGLPIIPVGVGFDRPWRMKSWDRFVLPRPWSLGTCVSGEPIRVPPDVDRDTMETSRQIIEAEISRLTEIAEQMARKAA